MRKHCRVFVRLMTVRLTGRILPCGSQDRRAHLASQVLGQRPRTTTLALFYDISVGIGSETWDVKPAAAYDVNLQLNTYVAKARHEIDG